MKRLNILFLVSGERLLDVMGYEGDPVVRTAVWDELAEMGVTFSKAYAPVGE
jgi:arylsulfatase A-like enzyme